MTSLPFLPMEEKYDSAGGKPYHVQFDLIMDNPEKGLIEGGLQEDLYSDKYSEPMFEEGFKITACIQQGIAILSGM